MNVKTVDKRVYVTLSHRNLRDLLDALEQGLPAVLSRLLEDGKILTIEAQWDKDHYSGSGRREAGPGITYPSVKRVEDMT